MKDKTVITAKKSLKNKSIDLKEKNNIKIKPKYKGLYGKTYDTMKSKEAKEKSLGMACYENMIKYAEDFIIFLKQNSIEFNNIDSNMEYFTGEYIIREKPKTLTLKISLYNNDTEIAVIIFTQQVYSYLDKLSFEPDNRICLEVECNENNSLDKQLDIFRRNYISNHINNLSYTLQIYSDEYNKRS